MAEAWRPLPQTEFVHPSTTISEDNWMALKQGTHGLLSLTVHALNPWLGICIVLEMTIVYYVCVKSPQSYMFTLPHKTCATFHDLHLHIPTNLMCIPSHNSPAQGALVPTETPHKGNAPHGTCRG